MLTGLLKCGKCGMSMIQSRRGKNGEYRYYVCQTYHKFGRDKCPQPNFKADEIEQYVLKQYTQALIEKINGNEELNKEIQSVIKDKLKNIEKEILRVQKGTLNLIMSKHELAEEQFTFANEELKRELLDLLNEKERLERRLSASAQLEDFNLALESIRLNDKRRINRELKKFIKEVVVNDNTIHISFNFK